MKTNRLLLVFLCVLILFFTLGAADVAHLADPAADGTVPKARLIGVLVTPAPLDLFDMDAYFADHGEEIFSGAEIDQSVTAQYEGKLYAELTDSQLDGNEYVFTGVEGYACFAATYHDGANTYTGNSGDEAISDVHMAIASTDEGENLSMEGTIYACIHGEANTFHYNPIYQAASGEVYAMAGQGASFGGDLTAGASSSHELKEETTTTEGEETSTTGTRIKITVCYVDEPVRVALLQMSGDGNMLSRAEFAPGELPEKLVVENGTAYVIVETTARSFDGQTVTRELFQPGDETLCASYAREDGICVKQWCEIDWNDYRFEG